MAPQLTPQQRQLIIVLREGGYTIKEIERRTGITRTTINLWLRRNEETGGDLSAHHRQLYQRATTAEQDAAIVERHTSSPFLNTQITATQYSVSTQTIRRRLQAVGMKTRVPAKKIVFSAAHAEARVGFCLQYYNFDWENNVVIFVDEKTFKSDRDGRKILKRRHNTRYHVENVIPNRSSGRLSLGFWGWMSSVGPGELVEISGRMTSEQYVDILRDVMVPTVRLHHPTGTIYLCQDNSSIHSARVVQAWLQAQPDIQLMPWPAKSPDLNPIENLWGQMVLN